MGTGIRTIQNKMTKRLNGWNRIGIILSVIWSVLVVSFISYHVYEDIGKGKNSFVTQEYVNIDSYIPRLPNGDQKIILPDDNEVEWQPVKIVDTFNYNLLIFFILALIIPIVLAWAAFYLSIWVINWIVTGFK